MFSQSYPAKRGFFFFLYLINFLRFVIKTLAVFVILFVSRTTVFVFCLFVLHLTGVVYMLTIP